MKNKIVSSLTALALLACIFYTPVRVFMLEFSAENSAFATVISKSFSKNTIFKNNFKFNFNNFTDNIIAKEKTDDFSSNFALMDKNTVRIVKQNVSETQKQLKEAIPADAHYSFGIIDRWRTRTALPDTSFIFVLFILLYIGMLRSVYVCSKNKSYILYFKTSVC